MNSCLVKQLSKSFTELNCKNPLFTSAQAINVNGGPSQEKTEPILQMLFGETQPKIKIDDVHIASYAAFSMKRICFYFSKVCLCIYTRYIQRNFS